VVETLQAALAKVQRRRLLPPAEREPYTQAEIDALSAWMALQIAEKGKETRAERSERNKASWQGGDRRRWGGDLRKRDKRRGWRNFRP
jgi:hypothetical protein